MDATATIIRPRKMRLLFEGNCHLRYVYIHAHYCLHITQCECGKPSGESILLWQHFAWAPRLQDSVDSAEGCRRSSATSHLSYCRRCNLQLKHVQCWMFSSSLIMVVAIPSPLLCVFALASVVAMPLGNFECFSMRRLFEGSYCFASLFAKCGANSKAATKQGVVSIRANTVIL